ncbi:enoyl-CoA hydratase-related protein [Sporichthya sp.]|uniref:enoyl-CoA hydratase-related protein n=1 Tax=Sporichthya sp. TaxID=65475 RepID=UPI00184F0440|nr:enoyl-CoA hydratase-related protein [Sporichthya sp.]MBA3743130.1 enoyl-CoA hydratase/isomerase family protein [Sporichthya sp.]
MNEGTQAIDRVYAGLDWKLDDGILTVTIDRPECLNAIDTRTMNELTHVFARAHRDDAVRVVIVTGRGRAFCAGGDLRPGEATFDAVDQGRADSAADHVETGGPLAMSVFTNHKPFIAAINGPAVGIGLTLTLPMDLRIAVPGAKLAMSFVRRGIVPDACATWFLPRLVGAGTALDWAVSGRTFRSEEAHRAGLVDELCPAEELLERANERAREYLAAAPVAIAATRALVWRMAGAPHPLDAYAVEAPMIFELGARSDAREGVRAFLDKRPPRFTQRVSADMPSNYPWWDRAEALRPEGSLPPFA